MLSVDNLNSVKKEALAFLYMDIEKIDGLSPLVVYHPFFESGYWGLGNRIIDLTNDQDGLQEVRKLFEEAINSARSVDGVFWRIRKSYRLTFLKYIKPYLTKRTFSHLLGEAWTTSENPNDDINVPVSMLIKWFRISDKKNLMEHDDYEIYSALPSEFEIFRGVAVGRVPKGLSWTRNYSTAEWFANRFNSSNESGYIQKAIISKDDVFAYFNTRGEDEIVADVSRLNIEILR